jgi:hypothetical protein
MSIKKTENVSMKCKASLQYQNNETASDIRILDVRLDFFLNDL